ncbi:MAG: IS1634 family transposase [Bacteroidales bacterium]|nr:IS1634 family transposase [Bacteroidales bacterium]
MFIRRIHKKSKNKTYTTVYLAESYRENGKVRHRHISNLSKWSDEMIDSLEKTLKGEKITTINDLQLSQGKSFGAIKVITEVAERLGIKQSLGNSEQGKLALFQIAGRIITQGSRNYLANEWVNLQDVKEVFKLNNFNHNDLYENLTWLSENQNKIEKKIFTHRNNKKPLKNIFLYDVTSSYLEGNKNELAEYGYNRDNKKGKKQIVIGLLTDDKGYPVSIEVFKGNTGDTKTVSSQLGKLKENFGVERVIFVGDKGMVKSSQIAEIESDKYKWNYLTTITKQQIQTLISENVIQLDLFAGKIIEVKTEDNIRYILRRNPIRAEKLKKNKSFSKS